MKRTSPQVSTTTHRDKLIREHQWLVLYWVNKYGASYESSHHEDLVQDGNLGLMRAVEMFDPARGVKFATYASHWVRAFVRKGSGGDADVKRRDRNNLVRPCECVSVDAGISMDASDGQDADLSLLGQLGSHEPTAIEVCQRRETAREVREVVSRLSARLGELGVAIVERRIMTDNPETLEQLANRFSLSRERIRQVQKKTLKILREHMAPLASEGAL
jgi:RNA polymerase sigma-32 factor